MAYNRKRIYETLNGRCFYCGCELDFDNFHIDHFTPKSKGGKEHDNLVPSCPECNLCKGKLSIEEFRNKIKYISENTFQGKIIQKYYGTPNIDIKFYFEEVQNG